MGNPWCAKISVLIAAGGGSLLAAGPARGVVVYGGTGRNTSPGGAPAGSGWQYEGKWGSFLGTPISPNLFITAGHVGGSIGQSFTYNGTGGFNVGP